MINSYAELSKYRPWGRILPELSHCETCEKLYYAFHKNTKGKDLICMYLALKFCPHRTGKVDTEESCTFCIHCVGNKKCVIYNMDILIPYVAYICTKYIVDFKRIINEIKERKEND